MTVGRICSREVDLIDADESVQVAADRMNSRNVGTLIVLDEESHPIGMITDRQIDKKGEPDQSGRLDCDQLYNNVSKDIWTGYFRSQDSMVNDDALSITF